MKHSKRGTRLLLQKELGGYLMVFALVFGASGMIYTLTTSSYAGLAHGAGEMLAASASSLTVAVAPNSVNTLAAELAAKDRALSDRESQLAQSSGGADYFGLASFVMSLVLLILVGINFYYDTRARRHKGPIVPRRYSVDLR